MKPTSVIQLFLLTILAFALAGCGGSNDVESLTAKADAAIAEGKLSEAENILRFALREDQKNPELLARIGDIYVQQGRLRDAFQVLSLVKQVNPNDSDSLASLASIELAAGMRDEALADARKALELDPAHKEAPIILAELAGSVEAAAKTKEWLESLPKTAAIHSAIGSLYLKSRNVGAAEENFESAIALDPNSPLGYAGKFQILLSQQKEEEAMATFTKAADVAPYRSGIRIRYAQILQQTEGDEAAKAALDEILENAPDYLPALSQAAELAAKMGDNEKAQEYVDSALQLDPIDPTAMRVNGTLLVLNDKTDEAIEQLEKVLELYPQDIKANYQVALAYLAKRDLGKAKSRLSRVTQLAPGHLESNALLSTLQVQEEDYSGAIITLEKYLEQNPNSIQGYLLLAEVYNRKGDNAAAVSIYKKLEESSSETSQLSYLSGLSYLQGRDSAGARNAFESALSNNPLHLQSVEQLTALDMQERNFDEALARIDQTIAASPDTSVLYTIRAQILQSKGDLDQAKQAFEKSIELDGNNRTARSLYARLLRSQGDVDGAFEQSQAIIESNPEDLGALTTISSIYESRGEFSEAVETYEKMLEIDDSYLPALNNLAYLYSTKFDKMDRAFELGQKARELAPSNPYSADTLGWIVYQRGDYPWALSLLQDSYNKLSTFAEVAYHLGSAHYSLGHRDAGLRLLEEATQSDSDYDGKDLAQKRLSILTIDTSMDDTAAVASVESHLSSNSNDSQAIATLATLHLRAGESSKAKDGFEKALELSPENVFAKLGLAEILSEDASNAARVYAIASEARELDTDTNRARALQGIALSQQGRADSAKTQFEAVDPEKLPASLRERIAGMIEGS
ncbi:tetratricopeptide repeat protein [Pelagicoccus mobilis]|uniref:Tetratricopeptide repeat protein n=1 Tax=Pelagicoccus mobilis TaxID=415221 RepID=A0A934S278_9BACT|nr:tetratricopeptide repeat protein [Pelagicoccus mobilis]MBK1880528.1 tetratricopeptide repeat protein [Pelagicoccus mobilis]